MVRQGLRRMIDHETDLEVCGEAQGEREARTAIRDLKPDVIVVDISLVQGDGLEAWCATSMRNIRRCLFSCSRCTVRAVFRRAPAGRRCERLHHEARGIRATAGRRLPVLDGGTLVSAAVAGLQGQGRPGGWRARAPIP